jgi:hypothetical protein
MRRGTRVELAVIGAVFALFASGCSSSGVAETSSKEEPELLVCEAHTFTDATGVEFTAHSRFVLPAINRKLALYPGLAEAVGFDHVSTCEQGHAYFKGKAQYAAEHPGFDDDQPLTPISYPDPGPYPDAPPTLEVPKMLFGFATFNNPVVRLVNNRNQVCTGVFIAKNWIVTSAACLAYQGPNAATKTQPISGYYPYRIDRPDSRTATIGQAYTPATINGQLLQYPHPWWEGWDPAEPASSAHNYDVALLYLNSGAYDSLLPPDPTNSAIRLTRRSPTALDTHYLFGWGPATWTKSSGALGPADTLRRGDFGPITTSSSTFTWTASLSSLKPCTADLGGSAMRQIYINGVQQWAAVGVLSGNLTDTVDPCAEQGDSMVFSRLDNSSLGRYFFESVMQIWNGRLFTCKTFALPPGTSTDYARCWGDPCGQDADCLGTEVCQGLVPGNSAIKGQCLLREGLTE